jgi:hypothetical protein
MLHLNRRRHAMPCLAVQRLADMCQSAPVPYSNLLSPMHDACQAMAQS